MTSTFVWRKIYVCILHEKRTKILADKQIKNNTDNSNESVGKCSTMKRNALMVTLTIKVSKRGENTALMINYK